MLLGFAVSMTMALMEIAGKPVFTNDQGVEPSPAVVDFHKPPLAAPAQTMFGDLGFTAIERTRPPMFVGPRERHWLPGGVPDVVRSRSLDIVRLRALEAFMRAFGGIEPCGSAR
jgi:hypothetical protein